MKTVALKMGYAPDEELVDKIILGETALFEVLIRRYNGLLYKIARSQGFNHQDAEDLMQESHYNAFMNLPKFRKTASYKTWLTRIHLNGCYHKSEDQHKRNEIANTDFSEGISETVPLSIENRITEKKILNRELGKVLEKSLLQLPVHYRNVFLLREVEGFSIADTSELLKITPVNVKVRLSRARAMLQKQLESIYSTADLFEFNLIYCDEIVNHVFARIHSGNGK
jgi:RNA polymerase sigma factor (sigma-70 family)